MSPRELGADHSVQADVLLGGFQGEFAVDFRGDADQKVAAIATLADRFRQGFAVGLVWSSAFTRVGLIFPA